MEEDTNFTTNPVPESESGGDDGKSGGVEYGNSGGDKFGGGDGGFGDQTTAGPSSAPVW